MAHHLWQIAQWLVLQWLALKPALSSKHPHCRWAHGHCVVPASQVRGRVATIRERSVELETGAVFPFDYLILAPGSTYADNAIKDVGGTAAERQALIQVGSVCTLANAQGACDAWWQTECRALQMSCCN